MLSANKPAHAGRGKEMGSYDIVLIIRLIIASVIFAVSLIIGTLPDIIRLILLVASAGIAGYDIVRDAVADIAEREFFSTPLIVTLAAVVSYVIDYAAEGAALVILYQIGLILIAYAEERTRRSALELLEYHDDTVKSHMTELILRDDAGAMNIEAVMGGSAGKMLKYAVIISVVYAVALPIITNYSVRTSVHRAITIILIATPMSVVVSMPFAGIIGMCLAARHGVFFESAAQMETVGDADIAVFDNTGVFCKECPRIIAVSSEVIDRKTFLTFAAHALYYSDQPVARAVAAVYSDEHRLELISNFTDIPGYGVEVDIGGAHVVLASRELFVGRGVKLPADKESEVQSFFMTVADRYVGKLQIVSELNESASELALGLKDAGVSRCILLTEDGITESRRIAEAMDFSEVYGECDLEKKLRIVQELKTGAKGSVMFIYASGVESHSAADIDVRINRRGKFADVLVAPDYTANLPFAVQVCKRVREIAIENAVFAYVVKMILVFLSIIGFCNVWFAIFIDTAAAIATILNTIRVTQESLISVFLYKTGQR